MKNIIKYQLLNRFQTFRIAAPIVVGLNILVTIVYGILHLTNNVESNGTLGFISFLAIASAIFVPLVHFFTASSGHITEILHKDSSYLLLTLPLKGFTILGGRILAGLIEFFAYVCVSFFSLVLNFSVLSGTLLREQFGINTTGELNEFLDQSIVSNLPEILKFFIIVVFNFLLLGSLVSFAAITSASFIRKRKPATVLAVIGALVVFNVISRLGSAIGESLAPNATISLSGSNSIELNLISALFMLCAATLLFFISSHLLEKKLEI